MIGIGRCSAFAVLAILLCAAAHAEDLLPLPLQPVGGSRYVGQSHTFTVVAAGGTSPLLYQWRKNGTNILAATMSSYTIASLVLADDADYSCRVSDSSIPPQSLDSNTAHLCVRNVLTISQQPAGANRAVGGSHTFTVTVTGGYTPLCYQWRKNGTNIAGTTRNTYTLAALVAGDQASYSCVVVDALGTSVTSNNAQLRVLAIQTQPANQSVASGCNATFSVVVLGGSGNPPYTYQWYKNGTARAGATLSTLTISNVTTVDNGNYHVLVGQTAGDSLASAIAVLWSEGPLIVITEHPAGGSRYAGQSHTFTCQATGGVGSLSYQWRRNNTDVAGATLTPYTIASVVLGDDADYRCRVCDGTVPLPQSVDSTVAHLYVRNTLSFIRQPVGGAKLPGDSHTFEVQATGGYLPCAYQWQKDGAPIAGATGPALTLAALTFADTGTYSCLVADSATGLITSADAVLVVGSLVLASPNGGEAWTPGTGHDILWNSSGLTGNARIYLYDNYTKLRVLGNAPIAGGTWHWDIPADETLGTTYRIRVQSLSYTGIGDYSDGLFVIGAAPSVVVTSPNGGEVWTPGTANAIAWTATGLGGNIRLFLYSGWTKLRTLGDAPIADGTWTWNIPVDEPAGMNYRIRAQSLVNPAFGDYGDGVFIIGAPPAVTVTAPNGGEILTRGTATSVIWDATSLSGNVRIYLYQNWTKLRVLGDADAAGESWTWNIPVGEPAAANYRIRVQSLVNTALSDYGDGLFGIVP